MHLSMIPQPERDRVHHAWHDRALRDPLTSDTVLRLHIDFAPAIALPSTERVIEALRRSSQAMRTAEHFERMQAALRQRAKTPNAPRTSPAKPTPSPRASATPPPPTCPRETSQTPSRNGDYSRESDRALRHR